MKKNYTFFIFGGSWGGGGIRRTQVNENVRAVRPHNRADKFITRKKNNQQFVKKCAFWAIRGGGAWVAHK